MKGVSFREPGSCKELMAKLPKVGDIINARMHCGDVSHGLGRVPKQDAVVTYVNREHLWYMLQFPCGVKQAYRVG